MNAKKVWGIVGLVAYLVVGGVALYPSMMGGLVLGWRNVLLWAIWTAGFILAIRTYRTRPAWTLVFAPAAVLFWAAWGFVEWALQGFVL